MGCLVKELDSTALWLEERGEGRGVRGEGRGVTGEGRGVMGEE